MDDILIDRNKSLSDILSLIGYYYSLDPIQKYRSKAFNTASFNIKNHPIAILSGLQAREEVKGVGKSIENTIQEYLNTGHVKRLDDFEQTYKTQKDTIDFFRSIYGIGPITAINLYNEGFRTLEDLWTQASLNESQRIGILWRDHINLKIPRVEMDLIQQTIGSFLNPYDIKWEITGSYRRQEPESSDIDILVESRSDLNMFGLLTLLRPLLAADLANGDTKYMGILRLSNQFNGHRIDIRIVPPENWPFALMYFTGSQKFNILMRSRAIELKLKLNEYQLYNHTGDHHPATDERDIFNLLRVTYLHPEQRLRNLDRLPISS